MAKIGDHATGNWGQGYVTERTKAMPKNTLFGSVLEQKTKDDYNDMDKIDVDQRKQEDMEKRLPRKRELPTRLKDQLLPGPEVIEHTKEQIKRQKARSESVAKYIQSAQERSLYFNKGPSPPRPDMATSRITKHQPWISEKDIEGADEINRVGLNDYNNYDTDRYRTRPPVHQYALIGDMLRPGMDFSGQGYTPSNISIGSGSRSSTRRGLDPFDPAVFQKRPGSMSTPVKIDVAGRDLPDNIKHKFGTKICAKLLTDTEEVRKTINQQEKVRRAAHRQYVRQPVRQMPLVDHPDYRDLGNCLRTNVLPGFHFHNPTLAKDTYTQAVFDGRFTDPDEYRMQRDELG